MSNPPPKPLFDRKMWTVLNIDYEIVGGGSGQTYNDLAIFSTRRLALDWLKDMRVDGDRLARVRVVVSEVGGKKGGGKK